MKKIYSLGPFGELYKIVLSNAFLERCKTIQGLMTTLINLQEGEFIEAYKSIPGKYSGNPYARITPEEITIGVFWAEGWEEFLDYDKSLENLPDVWFKNHLLWKFTTHAHRFSSDKLSEAVIDEEDRNQFLEEVKRYQNLMRKN